MQCSSCAVGAIKFEIKLEGETNLSALQIVVDHLKRREIEVVQKRNKLQIDEKALENFSIFVAIC